MTGTDPEQTRNRPDKSPTLYFDRKLYDAEEKIMKQNRKQLLLKILLGGLLVVLVAVSAGFYFHFTQKPVEGEKAISIEIVSSRDSFRDTKKYTTDKEYLGDFLVEKKLAETKASEYGRFIVAVGVMKADDVKQYWWSIKVDGEMSATGIDLIAVTDGSSYTLTLEQGY